MVKRRARDAGIAPGRVCNHTFRATGITAYMANEGSLEVAQEMAAHASPRTTRLYDRSGHRRTQAEVERIRILPAPERRSWWVAIACGQPGRLSARTRRSRIQLTEHLWHGLRKAGPEI